MLMTTFGIDKSNYRADDHVDEHGNKDANNEIL